MFGILSPKNDFLAKLETEAGVQTIVKLFTIILTSKQNLLIYSQNENLLVDAFVVTIKMIFPFEIQAALLLNPGLISQFILNKKTRYIVATSKFPSPQPVNCLIFNIDEMTIEEAKISS